MKPAIETIVREFLATRRPGATGPRPHPSAKAPSGTHPRRRRASWPCIETIERLEQRTLLSGETVTAGLGSTPLPAGKQYQVSFKATVDSPLAKGIGTVYNTGTVSGSNFAAVATDDPGIGGATDPTAVAVDRAPEVTAVYARSSAWSAGFLGGLQSAGLGDATFGYSVPAGAGQLAAVPWGNIDRVSVRFSKNVSVTSANLQLLGTNTASYGLNAAGFTYDSATFTATWALSGSGVSNDNLRLTVASGSGGVAQAGTGGGQLDGEWLDSTAAFPSGDGVAGGDFAFRLNVLSGDVNGDGAVNTTDGVNIRRGLSPAAYSPKLDVNADAAVNTTDFVNDRALIGATLPAAEPGGPAGSGWVAANTATPPTPSGAAGTTVTASKVATLVVDNDGDGRADPGDTIQYTVTITNTGTADATGVSFSDTLDAHTTLVAGSLGSTPVLADSPDAAALGYTENAAATPIAPNLGVADPDGALASASVTVTGWVNGQDGLAFTAQGGITPSYDATAGMLTFTGSASPSVYQTLLRSVTYVNSSDNPTTAARTVNFKVNDGTSDSNTFSRGIAVTAVNDAPVLGGIEGTAVAYNQNSGGLAVTAAVTVDDVDSANLASATVSISSGYVNGQDTLTFTNTAAITGSFNTSTGVLTLTGSTTPANYQAALRAVQFANTTGSATSKTITFQADDGAAANHASNTVSRTVAINLAPTVAGETFGSVIGNTPLLLGVAQGSTAAEVVAGSVLSNDSDPAPSSNPITINGNTAPSHGTVTLNPDGTFAYTPAAGYAGADSFTYTVRDSLGAVSQPATVSITVGTKVWYVDNSGSNGDGRAATPFNTLAGAVTASGVGDVIFVNTGNADYTAGITLKANQSLLGRGVALSVDPDGAGSLAAVTLLSSGTAPTLVTSIGTTPGVTLGNANTIRGLNIGSTSGAAILGSSFGTLNADTVAVNNAGNNRTGPVLDLTSGAVAATFTNLSTTSATTGLNLVNLTGSLTGSAGAISGVTGTDVNVGSGTANITLAGSVTNTAGNSVVVSGHTGGTVAFNGAISDSGTGISLTGNTGATVSFTGGLTLSTTTSAAFTATGGGTVNVTGANNTIATTTGTALNVANTTIGSSGVTFKSISANGGANGIILDTTGAVGGLTVTGTSGSTTRDSSGGTIQSITGADGAATGHGIYLNATNNVSLNHMNIHNVQGDGIHGNSVAGFTLTYTSMTTNGTTTAQLGNFHGEGDVNFVNLSGSAQVDHNDFQLAYYNTFGVFNVSAITLNRIVMESNTFGKNDVTGGNAGVVFQPNGGTMNITFGSGATTGNTITGAGSNTFILDMHGTATVDLIMKNNAISNDHTNIVTGGGGVSLQSGGAGDQVNLTFNVDSNTFSGSHGAGFFIGTGQVTNGNAFTGTFNNNTIGIQGTANSGSTTGNDLFLDNEGGTTNINVTNNKLYQYNPNGTGALQLQVANDNGHEAHATLVVTGNTISNPGTNAPALSETFNGIQLNAGTAAGDTAKTNLTLYGNTVAGSGNATLGSADIRLRQRFSATIGLFGNGSNYGGTPNDTTAIANFAVAQNGGTGSAVSSSPGGFFGTARFQLAAPGGVRAAKPAPVVALKASDLTAIEAAAILRWQKVGITSKQLSALKAVTIKIADLAGDLLGATPLYGGSITLDATAAGYGWYVDSTPLDDKEFAVRASATRFYSTTTAAPAGRMDLLTTVMHEMGHVLGLDSSFAGADRDGLMYAYLTTGERRLPMRITALR